MSHAVLETIAHRRSIRKFQSAPVPKALLEEILRAGMLAPSAKNRQPWRFVVTLGEEKEKATQVMARGIEREKALPLLPESKWALADAEHSLHIMEQAPAVIYIVNPFGLELNRALTPEERIYELCNTQSVGAAIQNMSLAADALGLGSLWIANTFFAYQELREYLGTEGALLSALAIGYPDESPSPRPRKDWDEIVEWR